MLTRIVTVLSVSPNEEDHFRLRGVFSHSNWALHQANGLMTASALIEERGIGVVVCERDLCPGTWIDLLERMRLLAESPPLIVVSRLADDSLWAEALKRGAYDVLAKPFEQGELFRCVRLAWMHWIRQCKNAAMSGTVLGAAS